MSGGGGQGESLHLFQNQLKCGQRVLGPKILGGKGDFRNKVVHFREKGLNVTKIKSECF